MCAKASSAGPSPEESTEKQPGGNTWRLIASRADGILFHKPCTVSGGGKSEISKPLSNLILRGPVFVSDFHCDMDAVEEILNRDFSSICRKPQNLERARRPILNRERSLGSVIKLLTPSADYTEEHNAWLATLPQSVRQLLVTVKRYYRPEWGSDWRQHFSVDRINGYLGHELKYHDQIEKDHVPQTPNRRISLMPRPRPGASLVQSHPNANRRAAQTWPHPTQLPDPSP